MIIQGLIILKFYFNQLRDYAVDNNHIHVKQWDVITNPYQQRFG